MRHIKVFCISFIVVIICTGVEYPAPQIKPAKKIPYVPVSDSLDILRLQYNSVKARSDKSEMRAIEAISKTNELLNK